MKRYPFLLPLALAAGGCAQSGSQPDQVCTLIGCESGLEVTLQPAPSGAYRVEVAAAGQTDGSVQCAAGTPCSLFFRDFTPATATVRVIVAGDTTTATVTPTYQTLQPNGPACPPTCRRGAATVRLDADD